MTANIEHLHDEKRRSVGRNKLDILAIRMYGAFEEASRATAFESFEPGELTRPHAAMRSAIVKNLADPFEEELDRLREAVWSDGRPWVSTHFAESCKFCLARVPYGTSEADQQQNYPHEPDCVWLAEDHRRKVEHCEVCDGTGFVGPPDPMPGTCGMCDGTGQ